MASTEVAATLPISNTGKVRLEVKKIPGPSVFVPIKGSIVISPGKYQVIARPTVAPFSVLIANIDYLVQGFRVVPTNDSVKDARFAVYVNLSDP